MHNKLAQSIIFGLCGPGKKLLRAKYCPADPMLYMPALIILSFTLLSFALAKYWAKDRP
jgi:hypothetical protein